MNVAFEPWIPVVTTSGKPTLVSLEMVLAEGDKFADLAVRPHERVALMRLLLCVAHAALDGPEDYAEWCDVPKRLPDAARTYLLKWKDSFDLFHPTKPWLQVPELNPLPAERGSHSDNEEGWTTLNKLSFTRASGNNSTLFDHESIGGQLKEYAPKEIALNLLSFQNFFVAGGKASSRLWGKIEILNPPNPKGGPCSGKSILFTFLRERHLKSSILLNLSSFHDLKLVYGQMKNWLGKPVWEMPISVPDDNAAIANATRTHLGRLVPQTRILRINGDRKRVLLGGGFVYPKFQDPNNAFPPDAFATIVANNRGERALLSARPEIAVWRELHSLLVRQKDGSTASRGPLCLLNVPDTNPCDIISNAMITNPRKAAEIVDFMESVFHVPSRLRTSEGTSAYESEVKTAESVESRLGWAVDTYREDIDRGWKGRLKAAGADRRLLKAKLHSLAIRHYWTSVEKNLPLLMAHIEAIGTDAAISTREAWRKALFEAAREAYRIACGMETPRHVHAFVKGWQRLHSKHAEPLPDARKTKEVNS